MVRSESHDPPSVAHGLVQEGHEIPQDTVQVQEVLQLFTAQGTVGAAHSVSLGEGEGQEVRNVVPTQAQDSDSLHGDLSHCRIGIDLSIGPAVLGPGTIRIPDFFVKSVREVGVDSVSFILHRVSSGKGTSIDRHGLLPDRVPKDPGHGLPVEPIDPGRIGVGIESRRGEAPLIFRDPVDLPTGPPSKDDGGLRLPGGREHQGAGIGCSDPICQPLPQKVMGRTPRKGREAQDMGQGVFCGMYGPPSVGSVFQPIASHHTTPRRIDTRGDGSMAGGCRSLPVVVGGISEPESLVQEAPDPSGEPGVVAFQEVPPELVDHYQHHQSGALPLTLLSATQQRHHHQCQGQGEPQEGTLCGGGHDSRRLPSGAASNSGRVQPLSTDTGRGPVPDTRRS